MNSEPVHHWDRVYRSLGSGPAPWEIPETPAEILRWIACAPAPARVIDLGCGRGHNTCALAMSEHDMVGIDFSSSAIGVARQVAAQLGLDNVSFEVADILRFRARQAFDLAIDYSVFHHIHPGDRGKYRDTVAALVRPDGLFGMVCYSDQDPSAQGGPDRVGSLGNTIHHPTADEVVSLFSGDFSLKEHGETRLGQRRHHLAHRFLFRRRTDVLSVDVRQGP
ncbi:class I SAM-dependent methyltransferase [Streptomyces shenzhenensis]|uniref:class I SAM-dependent methyltransferase n=1 Tax=Streptomyces shenzhenensis TaxID=943815 RepID=UPI001F302BEE|nr:methyltransferase domain-containing protein [Streptomyces shenzhenensis]